MENNWTKYIDPDEATQAELHATFEEVWQEMSKAHGENSSVRPEGQSFWEFIRQEAELEAGVR